MMTPVASSTVKLLVICSSSCMGRFSASQGAIFVLLALAIRPEISCSVEVDQVVGCFGDPYLGLPGDLGQVACHLPAGRKGGYIDEAGGCTPEQPRQLVVALAVHRPVAGHGFDQQ